MTQITLNPDQLDAVRESEGAIVLCDDQGNLVGYVSPPPTNEEIAEARRRLNSDGPWHTTKQVLAHLDSLTDE